MSGRKAQFAETGSLMEMMVIWGQKIKESLFHNVISNFLKKKNVYLGFRSNIFHITWKGIKKWINSSKNNPTKHNTANTLLTLKSGIFGYLTDFNWSALLQWYCEILKYKM